MGTNKDSLTWFFPVFYACFDSEEKMKYAIFLRLFAAAMCIPARKGYKNDTARRSPLQIWQEQITLLRACAQTVKQSDITGKSIKQRAKNVEDAVMKTGALDLTCEREFAKNYEKYNPEFYLSFYLYPLQQPCECTVEQVFQEVQEFYKCILTKIFETQPDALDNALKQMKCLLTQMDLDCTIPECTSAQEEAAWYLSALLILYASNSCKKIDCKELKSTLLGIIPPEESATRSVLCLDNVTMTISQFHTLCAAALRADPDLDELCTVFNLLEKIKNQVDGQLENKSRKLVTTFIDVLHAYYITKDAANGRDWLDLGYLEDSEEAKVARGLAFECKKWIT